MIAIVEEQTNAAELDNPEPICQSHKQVIVRFYFQLWEYEYKIASNYFYLPKANKLELQNMKTEITYSKEWTISLKKKKENELYQ